MKTVFTLFLLIIFSLSAFGQKPDGTDSKNATKAGDCTSDLCDIGIITRNWLKPCGKPSRLTHREWWIRVKTPRGLQTIEGVSIKRMGADEYQLDLSFQGLPSEYSKRELMIPYRISACF